MKNECYNEKLESTNTSLAIGYLHVALEKKLPEYKEPGYDEAVKYFIKILCGSPLENNEEAVNDALAILDLPEDRIDVIFEALQNEICRKRIEKELLDFFDVETDDHYNSQFDHFGLLQDLFPERKDIDIAFLYMQNPDKADELELTNEQKELLDSCLNNPEILTMLHRHLINSVFYAEKKAVNEEDKLLLLLGDMIGTFAKLIDPETDEFEDLERSREIYSALINARGEINLENVNLNELGVILKIMLPGKRQKELALKLLQKEIEPKNCKTILSSYQLDFLANAGKNQRRILVILSALIGRQPESQLH